MPKKSDANTVKRTTKPRPSPQSERPRRNAPSTPQREPRRRIPRQTTRPSPQPKKPRRKTPSGSSQRRSRRRTPTRPTDSVKAAAERYLRVRSTKNLAELQKKAGLPITRKLDEATSKVIFAKTKRRVGPYPNPQKLKLDVPRMDRAARLAKAWLKTPRDRNLLRRFQREAGIKVDGIYGSETAGAILWYTGKRIKPRRGGFRPYMPPQKR